MSYITACQPSFHNFPISSLTCFESRKQGLNSSPQQPPMSDSNYPTYHQPHNHWDIPVQRQNITVSPPVIKRPLCTLPSIDGLLRSFPIQASVQQTIPSTLNQRHSLLPMQSSFSFDDPPVFVRSRSATTVAYRQENHEQEFTYQIRPSSRSVSDSCYSQKSPTYSTFPQNSRYKWPMNSRNYSSTPWNNYYSFRNNIHKMSSSNSLATKSVFCGSRGRSSKYCKIDGCTRVSQRNNLCHSHGGKRLCKEIGCSSKDRGNGFCIKHGGGKVCSIHSCEKKARRKGLCTQHFSLECKIDST